MTARRTVAPDLECPRCGGSGRILNPAATGALYRAARQKLGLSLRGVARKAGISAPYLSDLERGNRTWPLSAQVKVSAALLGKNGKLP